MTSASLEDCLREECPAVQEPTKERSHSTRASMATLESF